MPKIMEYEHEYSFLDDDVLLKDGENGTHIITAKDAVLALLDLMNGSEVFYASCTTNGSTLEKEISIDDFTLKTGSAVVVAFASTNTVAAPSLKINDYDPIDIYYEGSPIAANLFLESHSYLMVYDGRSFGVVGDIANSFLVDYVLIDSIVNDLESDETNAPLSAAQGKALKELVDNAANSAANCAPVNHASAEKTYGIGTNDLFGHVKLSDSYLLGEDEKTEDLEGVAASRKALGTAYENLSTMFDVIENRYKTGDISGAYLNCDYDEEEEELDYTPVTTYISDFDIFTIFLFALAPNHPDAPTDAGTFFGFGIRLEDGEDDQIKASMFGHSDSVDGFYYGKIKYVEEKDEDGDLVSTAKVDWTLDDFSAEVGTVTTGEAGTEAEVENVGTSKHVILDFKIPKGDKGDSFDITEDAYFDSLDTFASTEMRRTTFRGKNLGTAVTDEQWAEITAGTFKGLFCGDYLVINGYNWRIVDFDYWYKQGDTSFTSHHILVMPDAYLYTAQMNDSNTTEGAYVGSQMYTTNLADAKTAFNSAFGSSHVLTHREYLQNAVTSGYPSAGSWYDSTVELPNEEMMYGSIVRQQSSSGGTNVNNATVSKTQLALMALNPYWINPNRQTQWLRDVVSATDFAYVDRYGGTYNYIASNSGGVRPVAAIG